MQMSPTSLLLLSLLSPCLTHPTSWQGVATEHNQGWAAYLADEPSEFHSLPLSWELDTSLPAWLRGSYVKNGPGQRRFGDERQYSSYLDSWGKLHKFTFTGEQATYSGRMIETANYNKSRDKGKMVPTITLAHVQPNDWNVFEMLEGAVNGFDNTNVMLWKLGPADKNIGSYISVTDYPDVHEMDPDSLAVRHKWGLNQLTEGISLGSCAHWRREVGKDSSINFHMIYNPLTLKPDFVLYRFGNTYEEREVVGKFPMDHMSLVHMFSNTVNYAVIALYPVSMDFWGMANHNMHPFETIKKIDAPTKMYLMDLRDGTVIDGFESVDPILTFSTHHMNAWEEGEEVVFDLACNPWDAMAAFMDIENMLDHPETDADKADFVMKRVRMNMKTKTVVVEDWPNKQGIPMLNTVDFPVINNAYTGHKNRFAYGWVSIDYWKQTLVKKDLEDSMNDLTWSRPSHYPGELFFIPNPAGEAEDDGLLVTVVFDGEKEQSYLLLLDGKTFEVVNYSYLPVRVPFSFHGNWFPELY
jgi:carotenoid cleavage dioxygenase-like enzyme